MDLSRQKKESLNMMIRQWKVSTCRNRKKKEEKWEESERPVRQHPVKQHMHYGSSENEKKGAEKVFEDIMA